MNVDRVELLVHQQAPLLVVVVTCIFIIFIHCTVS